MAGNLLRRLLTTYLVPVLVVAVGAHQVWRAHTGPLTSARGGGFGMFSSNDHGLVRFLRVVGYDASGARVLACGEEAVPDGLRRRLDEARWDSSHTRLTELARAVRARLREDAAAENAPAGPPPGATLASDGACPAPAALDRVRVEMWTVEFDPLRNRVRTRPVSAASAGGAP